MSQSVNKVILVGYIGRIYAESEKVIRIALATDKPFEKVREGEKTATDWHNLVIFNDKLQEFVRKYLLTAKKTKLYVEGSVTYRMYDNPKTGVSQLKTSIFVRKLVVLSSERGTGEATVQQKAVSNDFSQAAINYPEFPETNQEYDNEIPF